MTLWDEQTCTLQLAQNVGSLKQVVNHLDIGLDAPDKTCTLSSPKQ